MAGNVEDGQLSYNRTYSATVSGTRTESVSYPASEHGGSTSVTVTIDIPVYWDVTVDTSPFDRSVGNCEGSTNALAVAVVATSSAQVAAITDGANRVADSILSGFFSLVRSELSQQVSENSGRCAALLLKLNELKAACLARTAQFQKDFGRISGRYATLFQDLDNELSNRVRSIDGPAFAFRDGANSHDLRIHSAGASGVPTLIAAEEGQARTNIGICRMRNNAVGLLQKAGRYLQAVQRLNDGVRSVIAGAEIDSVKARFVPVLYAEAQGGGGASLQRVVVDAGTFSAIGAGKVQQELTEGFQDQRLNWVPMDADTRQRIETFLNIQIGMDPGDPGSFQARVGAMMMDLWRAQTPSVIRCDNSARSN